MPETSEYKGNPILTLDPENAFNKFSFGLTKAKLILFHIKDIEEFVKNNDKPKKKDGKN